MQFLAVLVERLTLIGVFIDQNLSVIFEPRKYLLALYQIR